MACGDSLPSPFVSVLFLALGSSRGHLKVTGGSGPAFVPRARAGDCAGLQGSGPLRHAWGERATVEEAGVPGRPQGPLLAAAATQPRPAETPRLAPPRRGHTRSLGPVPGSPLGSAAQGHQPPARRGNPRPGDRKRPAGRRFLGGAWSLTSELPSVGAGGSERG